VARVVAIAALVTLAAARDNLFLYPVALALGVWTLLRTRRQPDVIARRLAFGAVVGGLMGTAALAWFLWVMWPIVEFFGRLY
jgi:hypothetical protein